MKSVASSFASGVLQHALRPLATILHRRLAMPLFLLCAVLLARPCDATPGQWDFTGSLSDVRKDHTATLLTDGRVLVAGGRDANGDDRASAELYDPATGNWTPTGSLATGRILHTATLLADGKVLVVGGFNFDGDGNLASAELYDPATGMWTPTGSLQTARSGPTATLLPTAKSSSWAEFLMMVTWGGSELYDPATGLWATTGGAYLDRFYHTATLLADGRVLVTGGYNANLGFLEQRRHL